MSEYRSEAKVARSTNIGATGYPTAAQLAEAVEEFLREEVMPAVEGRLRFQALVAANVMAIIGREAALGSTQVAAQAERLARLGVRDDSELAAAIRDGTMDDRTEELLAILRESVEDSLRVANPRHLR